MGITTTTTTLSLVDRLSELNKDLEENGLLGSLNIKGEGIILLGELSRLIDLLFKDIRYEEVSYSSFTMCYLQMMLGKELNITRTVDVLCNEINTLDSIGVLDRNITNKLVCNVKGRLRRLPVKDSTFTTLLELLQRLGGTIPSDVLKRIEVSSHNTSVVPPTN